ncbi:MAG: histone deacetylase [Myxococcota bacterium]
MNPLRALLAKGRRRPFRVYYDEAYRLPITGAEAGPHALETRRADDAVHYLLHEHAVSTRQIINPQPASYSDLARVHTAEYLDSLHDQARLAEIFAVDPSDVYVDEVLRTLRLGVGGTIEAARFAVNKRRAVINTFGGFHHAAPARGAGFCALNDVAIAISLLRAEGFDGRVAVLDFDFHPPDGTAECLGKDPSVWLGSISGADWGPLPGVDETVLPEGTTDDQYLAATRELLERMPRVDLAFVLAGADVLTGDRLGHFQLSLPGTRERELLVSRRLGLLPQVWLPAGGYSAHAWKVLAGVGFTLAFDDSTPIPTDYDPLAARMTSIARTLSAASLGNDPVVTEADLADALGLPRRGPPRLLDYYTAEGLEYGLERYRLLPMLRRLGFSNLRVVIDRIGPYDRARTLGTDAMTGRESALIELEVEKRRIGDELFLFVNWLSLRNPRAHFSALRPQLPGQEVPGLGLAREMTEILTLMARRLMLAGVAFRPSWFHMAWAARHGARFVDSKRQGRFEALVRDVSQVSLLEATRAVAEGRVKLNGQPYAWEPDEMVRWRDQKDIPNDAAEVAEERERCHFTLS